MHGPCKMENKESDLYLFLGRIDAKLDAALHRIARYEADLSEVSKRVSLVEKLQEKHKGLVVGLGVAGGVGSGTAVSLLSHLFGG